LLLDLVVPIHPSAFDQSGVTALGSYAFRSFSNAISDRRFALYHLQETLRFRSSLSFWINALVKRNRTRLDVPPLPDSISFLSSTPTDIAIAFLSNRQFLLNANFLLDLHWRHDCLGHVADLVYSYLRPSIDKHLLLRYRHSDNVGGGVCGEKWWEFDLLAEHAER
jgi:hypothetical protein